MMLTAETLSMRGPFQNSLSIVARLAMITPMENLPTKIFCFFVVVVISLYSLHMYLPNLYEGFYARFILYSLYT